MQDSQAWKQWNAEEWSRQLLLFCFAKDAQAAAWQGIRASEDDLPVLTGDDEAAGTEQAEALLRALETQARVQPGSVTPASLMAGQVNRFQPSSPGLPPFFAFLWVTCLLAHGFPDPQMEGRFHMRFNAVFSTAQARHLKSLPQGWEKLSLWLANGASFDGAPHRQLQLRPVPLNASRIGHSWTLSFPRLGDRRLLHEHLRLDQQRGYRLDPWSPSLISRLLQVRGFSHDFRTELEQHAKDLRQAPDLDSWFTGFLLAEIDQLFSNFDSSETSAGGSSFGPLLLKSHGQATGVLLLAGGLPTEAITAGRVGVVIIGVALLTQRRGSWIRCPEQPLIPLGLPGTRMNRSVITRPRSLSRPLAEATAALPNDRWLKSAQAEGCVLIKMLKQPLQQISYSSGPAGHAACARWSACRPLCPSPCEQARACWWRSDPAVHSAIPAPAPHRGCSLRSPC